MANLKDIEAAAHASQKRQSALTHHETLVIPIVDRLCDGIRIELGLEASDPSYVRTPVQANHDPSQKRIGEHVLRHQNGGKFLFAVNIKPANIEPIDVQLEIEPCSILIGGKKGGQGWELQYEHKQVAILAGETPSDDDIAAASVAVTEAVKASVGKAKRRRG